MIIVDPMPKEAIQEGALWALIVWQPSTVEFQEFHFDFTEDTTTMDLKKWLADRVEATHENIRVVFGLAVLQNEVPLVQYGIARQRLIATIYRGIQRGG